ncbi:transposase [Streptomyces sp. E-08]|uniref:transposase n=1 Tax=Streptomyces sp. E-08 TaxID=3404047 RepID=UPI003CE74A62
MSLTDAQWARIEPLPDRAPWRGGRWRDHRQVIDAIAFKNGTGTPWMDLPEHFGSWRGAHRRIPRRTDHEIHSPQTATDARSYSSSRLARQVTHPRSPRSWAAYGSKKIGCRRRWITRSGDRAPH